MLISGNNTPPIANININNGAIAGDNKAPGEKTVANDVKLKEVNIFDAPNLKEFLATATGNLKVNLDEPPVVKDTSATLVSLSSFGEAQLSADIYAFMALFQKMSQEMRNTARTQRTTDFQGQIASLEASAETMKEAAVKHLTSAIVQGAFQMVSGAVQGAMSASAASKSVQGAKSELKGLQQNTPQAPAPQVAPPAAPVAPPAVAVAPVAPPAVAVAPVAPPAVAVAPVAPPAVAVTPPTGDELIAEGKILATAGLKLQGLSQGISGMIGAAGSSAGAGIDYSATLQETRKTQLETLAKVSEASVADSQELMNQMLEVIRDVRDKLGAIQQSQVETARGIARNI